MTWQRFTTWQRCCSASKRFTNASDPGASRLAAALGQRGGSRTPFPTQSSLHQKHCNIFIIFHNNYFKLCQFKTCQNTFKTQAHISLSVSLCLYLSVVLIQFQFDASIYPVLPGSCVAVPFKIAITWHLPPRIHQFLSSFLWSLLFLHGLTTVSQDGIKSLVQWQKKKQHSSTQYVDNTNLVEKHNCKLEPQVT